MLTVQGYTFKLLTDILREDSIKIMNSLVKAYDALRQRNPKHELLQQAPMDEARRGFNITPGFIQRYVTAEDERPIEGFRRYLSALELALQE